MPPPAASGVAADSNVMLQTDKSPINLDLDETEPMFGLDDFPIATEHTVDGDDVVMHSSSGRRPHDIEYLHENTEMVDEDFAEVDYPPDPPDHGLVGGVGEFGPTIHDEETETDAQLRNGEYYEPIPQHYIEHHDVDLVEENDHVLIRTKNNTAHDHDRDGVTAGTSGSLTMSHTAMESHHDDGHQVLLNYHHEHRDYHENHQRQHEQILLVEYEARGDNDVIEYQLQHQDQHQDIDSRFLRHRDTFQPEYTPQEATDTPDSSTISTVSEEGVIDQLTNAQAYHLLNQLDNDLQTALQQLHHEQLQVTSLVSQLQNYEERVQELTTRNEDLNRTNSLLSTENVELKSQLLAYEQRLVQHSNLDREGLLVIVDEMESQMENGVMAFMKTMENAKQLLEGTKRLRGALSLKEV